MYQDVGEEHKKRSGILFQTMKLLSYLGKMSSISYLICWPGSVSGFR